MTEEGGGRKIEIRSSRSRSRSPISGSDRREGSPSPETVSSPPVKLSAQRISVNAEHDPTDRDLLTLDDDVKQIQDDGTTATAMSHSQKKKRSQHRHHHHRHKQPKSNKRSSSHHRHSAKRSKKEVVSTTRNNGSEEGSMSVSEKNTSESEASRSEQEISSTDNESNNEEGAVEATSPRSERRNHRRKKHRSPSSVHDTNSQSPSSSPLTVPKNNKGTQLIVNYLPSSLRESDFYQLFARIGPVKLCKLVTDRSTGHSHCYGFIEYQTTEDTLKAIEKFNGYRIEHKKLKVSYAQPKSNNNDIMEKHPSSSLSTHQRNANLYLRDIPDTYDEQTLERLFSKYGEIVKTKVLRDPRTRISRGVAFVLMASGRHAERAVKALDGYIPSGTNTPISVKFADPEKTASSGQSSSSRLPNVPSMAAAMGPYGYPPGLPPLGIIDPYYAAAALHHHHRAAMNMRDLSPSPPPPPPMSAYYSSGNNRSYDNHTGGSSSRSRGSSIGLPRSYSSSSSKHALLAANTSSSHSHPTGVSSSRSLNSNKNNNNNNTSSTPSSAKGAQTLAAACDLIQKGYQQAIDPNGFVIYAFGLPHDCDETDLEELFRRYGEVYRVFIVRNYTTGESKGYSFVTMRNYAEASHAIDRLNGSTFKGRTLQVRFKQ